MELKADGAAIADIATATAGDCLHGQTATVDTGPEGPGRIDFTIQRPGLTGADTITAEAAFATLEIDAGKTAVAADDDVTRAAQGAVEAAGAAIGKGGRRPG